jgi:hypothetical protein
MVDAPEAPIKRPPGRPPVADKRRKRALSLSNAEWAALKAEAAGNGMTVADWVRLRCLPKKKE